MTNSPLNSARIRRSSEEGMTVVEAMVAFVIIAMILIATAYALSVAFRTSATNENRNRASAIAQDVIAVAKQADYKQLYVNVQTPTPAALFGAGRCSTAQTTVPGSGMSRVATGTGTPYKGLVYCESRQAGNENGGVGTTFYVQTKIVYLTASQGATSTNYYPKRVYVEIKWQDVAVGEGKWNTYTTSYTRTPSVGDCIPDQVTASGTIPAGCRP